MSLGSGFTRISCLRHLNKGPLEQYFGKIASSFLSTACRGALEWPAHHKLRRSGTLVITVYRSHCTLRAPLERHFGKGSCRWHFEVEFRFRVYQNIVPTAIKAYYFSRSTNQLQPAYSPSSAQHQKSPAHHTRILPTIPAEFHVQQPYLEYRGALPALNSHDPP